MNEETSASKGVLHEMSIRQLAESFSLGYALVEQHRVQYVNDVLCKIIGLSSEEIGRLSPAQMIAMLAPLDSSAQASITQCPDAPGLAPGWFHYILKRPDGSTRNIGVLLNYLNGPATNRLEVIVEDLTERMDADRSASQYIQAFLSVTEPIAILTRDLRYVIFNSAECELTGYSLNELAEQSISLVIEQAALATIMNSLSRDKEYRGTVIIRRRDGATRTVEMVISPVYDVQHQVINYLCMKHDITIHIRKAAATLAREKQIRMLLDSLYEHVNYYTSPELFIVSTNRAAAESLGMSQEQLIGRHCYELWHQRTEICDDCPIHKTFETGVSQSNVIHTPDGRTWFIHGVPVHDEDGQLKGVVEITRNISAETTARRTLEEAKTRAELFNDLMAHDLNNIFQGILIGLELIAMDMAATPQLRDKIEQCIEQVARGVTLIANVKRLAHIENEPIMLRQTSISSLIRAAKQMVVTSFPKRELVVRINIPPEHDRVMADEFLLDAVENVLHNAVKHSKKSPVEVDVVSKVHDAHFVEIRFEDNGPGIDENRRRVLLLRKGMRSTVSGGMGLALIQRICNRYGGQMTIEDRVPGQPHEGTAVVLILRAATLLQVP